MKNNSTIISVLITFNKDYYMSIFEAAMMLCFGASWPFQVAKTYKTKDVKGKSIFFLWLVEIGYICGMIHKVLYNPDIVLFLYLLNFALVGTDMILYYMYKDKDSQKSIILQRTYEKKEHLVRIPIRH